MRLPRAGEPLRLLVADDNLVAGELLERTVGALGWRADCVGSGSEAVARVQWRWPRAVATTWC